MLPLDDLSGTVRAVEQSDHRRAVAAAVEEDRAPADVVLRRGELGLRRLDLRLQHQRVEPESVDVRLGGGQPFVGGGDARGHVGERAVETLPLGLGLGELLAGRLLGRARSR